MEIQQISTVDDPVSSDASVVDSVTVLIGNQVVQASANDGVDPLFELVDVKGVNKRVRILCKNLRNYIYYSMDLSLFPASALVQSGDSAETLKQRSQLCMVPMSSALRKLETFQIQSQNDIESGDVSWEGYRQFVDMLQAEQDVISKELSEQLAQGKVTYESLNAYLNIPGKLMGYTSGQGHIIGFTTISCSMERSMFGGPYLAVKGSVYVNNGKGVTKVPTDFQIYHFKGLTTLKELGVYDLSTDAETKAYLLNRGKKYMALTEKPQYMAYTGEILRKKWWYTNRFKAKGRVMVDIGAMRSIDSNYDEYFGHDRYNEERQGDANRVKNEQLTEEVILCTPPYVYGFSFTAKQWGEMNLEQINDISFRSDAFDKLVLDADTKDIVFSLVETEYSATTDLIDGKGGGCIFLLEGPPGVGKTLTAEAVAERLKRPLYMVGVGELGTDVSTLEETLRNILDVANTWNAVLLIDEADIFLRKRDDANLERNAMVGVFLRLLEYYPGILFLTTNLAGNIDQAFFSRISMAIHYSPLEEESRATIWKNLLETSKIEGIDIAQLAKVDLNGRQIKNCIRNASALAFKAKRPPAIADFQRVISKAVEFEANLKK